MNCWHCDTKVIWRCDYPFGDFGYHGEGIVSVFDCPNCEAEYESRCEIK